MGCAHDRRLRHDRELPSEPSFKPESVQHWPNHSAHLPARVAAFARARAGAQGSVRAHAGPLDVRHSERLRESFTTI